MTDIGNTENVVVATFYRFVELPDFEALKDSMMLFCKRHNMKGTILLADEGVNATVSGTREAIDTFFAYLDEDTRLAEMPWKESYTNEQPFGRMKVRLKKEIVKLAVDGVDAACNAGAYVKSEDWDDFLSDPDSIVIDTRNDYEIKIGTFEGAVDPKTQNFRDFPKWAKEWMAKNAGVKKKKIGMFCTGGVRCEKSTAFMKDLGFDDVYHLEGGILKYLEDTQNKNHKWQGECFLFDDRVAVDDRLVPTGALICSVCNEPTVVSDDLKVSGGFEQVICIPCMEEKGVPQRSRKLSNNKLQQP